MHKNELQNFILVNSADIVHCCRQVYLISQVGIRFWILVIYLNSDFSCFKRKNHITYCYENAIKIQLNHPEDEKHTTSN